MSLVGKSLDAVATTGPGEAIFTDTPKTQASIQWSYTGTPSDAELSIESTLDGVNWKSTPVFVAPGDASGKTVGLDLPAFTGLRANLTAISGGSSPTVTAWVAAA